MEHLPAIIGKPDAIIVISAHWEEKVATVLGSSNPVMFYDYYGFPDEAYNITYPAPGNIEIAFRVAQILKERGTFITVACLCRNCWWEFASGEDI